MFRLTSILVLSNHELLTRPSNSVSENFMRKWVLLSWVHTSNEVYVITYSWICTSNEEPFFSNPYIWWLIFMENKDIQKNLLSSIHECIQARNLPFSSNPYVLKFSQTRRCRRIARPSIEIRFATKRLW